MTISSMNKFLRCEDYVLEYESRKTQLFQKHLVAKALLNLSLSRYVSLGCDSTLQGHQDDVSSLDIDDGEQLLLCGSYSGSVSIVKYKYLNRNKYKKPIQLNLKKKSLKTIKWCPLDLRLFMVTTGGGGMSVCDTTMEKVIHSKQFQGEVYFDWDEHNFTNSKVAVADQSRNINIVDFRVGMDLPQTIRWDDVPIDVVRWFPSKHNYLYAGRRDGTIGVFDIRSSRGVIAHKKIHDSQMFSLRFSSDGRRLISADRGGIYNVTDTWDFSIKATLDLSDQVVEQPIFIPDLQIFDGPDLYVASNFMSLTVWKVDEGKSTQNYKETNACFVFDQPFVFRESSYEIITGSAVNHLSVLAYKDDSYSEEENPYQFEV